MGRFKDNNRDQGLFLTINLHNQLLPGTLEYTVDYLLENRIDLTELINNFRNTEQGASAYHPKDLLKVLFLAYLRGIYSLRQIERLCKENITFMALCGEESPDHATIGRFIHRLQPFISSLFQQLLLYCDELNLLSGSVIAIDGCKIPSNAAKDASGTFVELEKKKQRFQRIAEEFLAKSKTEESDDFKRRAALYLKKVERFSLFLETHEKRIGSRKREVKSNITDNESAKLTGSHGIVQGYNALAAVDEKFQIITSAKAVGTQNEGLYLKDLIESSRNNLPQRISKDSLILADTGYFSEENCRYLFESKQKGIIPDNHFRQRDPRFHRDTEKKDRNPRRTGKDLFKHEMFTFDPERNLYICPAGKLLRNDGKRNMHGHRGRRYVQKDGACELCHLKSKCIRKGGKNRNLFIVDVPKPMTFSDKMRTIIDTPSSRETYSKRMGIVEPVFGNITHNKGLKRFNYRGNSMVDTVWMLFCMVHNIGKIHKYGNSA